ncbi:hypothetical protein TTHERM_000219069 (macronuclear) [Tetrahymena thermophila SB210]|uniref:Transmembrane protein n=1 Tax=Tetrahymena thermophila (strain SB210) TaxID=312017 RepID=W7XIH3_TETTS|nr:hypothetical protein TTHERM_000219069 [Tetrahymena thermophila SB210]EWS73284.1 hypothetical protein TTHERM_000219069 [Tetrahymena thermophila SB210]|eukprot:XP_012654193.1 hypothetical protein TTHERM_000219069 [Tetrahymena thermophila SB210]
MLLKCLLFMVVYYYNCCQRHIDHSCYCFRCYQKKKKRVIKTNAIKITTIIIVIAIRLVKAQLTTTYLRCTCLTSRLQSISWITCLRISILLTSSSNEQLSSLTKLILTTLTSFNMIYAAAMNILYNQILQYLSINMYLEFNFFINKGNHFYQNFCGKYIQLIY